MMDEDDIDEYYSKRIGNSLIDDLNYSIINQVEGEEDPLLKDLMPVQTSENTSFQVYLVRWWVLGIFMLLSLNQCNFWITFGTVAELASGFYNVKVSTINWLSAVGPLSYIPLSVVMSWTINRYGLRKNIIFAAFLVALGGILRAIPQGGSKTFPLIVVGQVLNASAGPIVMVVPTKLSATWFAPKERTLATALGTLANFVGSAIGFLLALVVDSGSTLKYLLYGEAGFAILMFIAILAYYPEKPPTPPSATSFFSDIRAQHKPLHDSSVIYKAQMTLFESWKELLIQSSKFMLEPSAALLTIACSITSGVYAGWSAVFVEIVQPIYTPEQSKWLGFYGILAGLFGGIILGWVHDKIHNFKKLLIVLFILNTIVYTCFALLIQGIIPNWYWLCQIFNVFGGFLINGYYPLIYEAAVEVSYPVPESIGTSIISIMLNIITFAAIMVSSIVPSWYISWILVGGSTFSLILILFVKENYKRSEKDNLADSESRQQRPISSSPILSSHSSGVVGNYSPSALSASTLSLAIASYD
ncbi:hypothetical protein CYY_006266 [Polysphondylium violaceum]|uniref:Major facilitator superfamily (MFS) profile domain-containing protein n=1 Tax=Polysphondylium violaceum TaxID=133409 RepID=A0A8J4Q0H9_9MYCE|nr:hypothetical protein CYY_006266 [Polysphondylium violaceum]